MNRIFLFQIIKKSFQMINFRLMNFKIKSESLYLIITLMILVFMILTFSLNFIKDTALILLINNFYHNLCHQIESRTFFIDGKPMLICSRCTGIYSGSLTLFFILTMISSFRKILDKFNFRIVLLLSAPLLIDWSLNFIFKIETTNFVRFLTGFLISLIPVYFLNSLIMSVNKYD